jgi:hypothetical protein
MFDDIPVRAPVAAARQARARRRNPPSLHLITSAVLIVSLAVALTAVSIGIARARAPVAVMTEMAR